MKFTNAFTEENPFIYIKTRYILLCLFIVVFILSIQAMLIYLVMGIDYKKTAPDPIILGLLSNLALALTIGWTIRQLKLIQINVRQIVGQLIIPYSWLVIIGIVAARIFFSLGIFRVSYYPLSFIFPKWVASILTQDFFLEASKSSFPSLYYLLVIIGSLLVTPIAEAFLFQGVVLHRWSAKWGVKPAIITLSLLYSILYSSNFLGGFSLGLMQTLFYIKSKTLLVPIVARIINNAIIFVIFFLTISVESSVETFRSQLGIGVVCLASSTPLLIWLLYKNRIRPGEKLPYFANANR
ncbi:MAG TPA: type II CAAX endopeptidase family protein [Waterburya sp.]|jgi:hypothetical protein